MKFLIQLMLAQAQEIFVLKVITGDLEQKKNSLISKLCQATANYYEECHKLVNQAKGSSQSGFGAVEDDDDDEEENNDDGFEDELDILGEYGPDAIESPDGVDDGVAAINSSWIAILEFKKHYYSSLALYFYGLQCESSKKYGEAIAYLGKSTESLNEISSVTVRLVTKLKTFNCYELLDNYKYQKDAVAIKLTELEKDNDFIYNEIVPLKGTLAAIKPMDGVKIIPITSNSSFKEINEYNYNNFFSNVVPINIHELMSFYSEEKSQFLRNEIDLFDVSNEELSSIMEYLKMPKSLVNLKESVNDPTSSGDSGSISIPTDLSSISLEISQSYQSDESNKREIQRLRAEIFTVMQKCESNKDNEELRRLKKSFIDSSNRDKELYRLILTEDTPLYVSLSKGPNSKEFKELFTPNNSKASNEDSLSLLDIDDSKLSSENLILKRIHDIEEILHDLHTIKVNKGKVIDKLKAEIHNEDISDILILNAKVKTNNEIKNIIFPEELKKFEKYSQQLDSLVSKQKVILERLSQEWSSLSQDPKVREIQSSSKFQLEILKHQGERTKEFYGKWKTYSSRLNMGVGFYKTLLTHAEGIYKNIQDKKEQESLVSNLGEMNLGSHPKYGVPIQHLQNYPPQQEHQSTRYQPGPSQNSSYGQPNLSHQNSGYGQPALSNQNSGYGQPTLPHQNSGYGQPILNQHSGPIPRQNSIGQGYAPSSNYDLPPQLPPKPQQQSPQQPPQNQQGNLIYNQPSTYQPNMYNYFSSN